MRFLSWLNQDMVVTVSIGSITTRHYTKRYFIILTEPAYWAIVAAVVAVIVFIAS